MNHVALVDCGPELLADHFLGLPRGTSAGYVMVVPRTFAKEVRVRTVRPIGLVMSSVQIPQTSNASAMSER
jgi:hypothetical protein